MRCLTRCSSPAAERSSASRALIRSVTTAARKSEVKAAVALKAWRVSIRSNSVPWLNGPMVCAADHEAAPATRSAAGAAPLTWNRHAAHPRNGMSRNSSPTRVFMTATVTAPTAKNMAASSAHRAQDRIHGRRYRPMHNRNGATTSTPIASPVHHTAHAERNCDPPIAPDRTRVPAPIEALTIMLSRARTTTAAASRSRSICHRNPTAMRSVATMKGASVFPKAVAAAAHTWALMGAFTAKAATRIPGHTRRPRMRKATTAIPDGGHSGVTFFPTRASWRLRCAAR